MAQNYTEQLRKDNVRDAIYEDAQNNFEVLRTSWSGNAFPANPKVGQPCYRVDEDKLYYWDGLKWSQKGGGGSAELKSMELPAIETERVSIILEGARCLDKNMMFVFVDKIAQDPSTYSMNDDGTVVNFNPAIPANAAVTLRWFDTDVGTTDTSIIATDEEVSAGVALDKVPNVSQLSTSIGKVPVGVKTYSSSLVYKSGELVISSGENVAMYKSLIDGNTGHALTETEYWEEISLGGAGVEIGDIGFAPLGIDESLNLRRYLNGQVISQSQFVSFTNKVKSAIALYPNLATTEANWQAEKTNSKLGQCGKFVIDDTAGTIRLPCVVNAQGLVDLASIGGIKAESLPNAKYYDNTYWASESDASGSLVYSKNGGIEQNTTAKKTIGGASIQTVGYNSYGTLAYSSSTYQDNAPVQQEAVQYPYYIQVATGVEETLPAIREYNINTPFFFGQSMYSDVAPDNASWLVSNGQYNAKTVYPDYYDWLLEQMNAGVSGFVASTASYTDYDFVINTADQTFRLPLKNGQEGVFADGVKGNGMTLGLTNGTNNYGLGSYSTTGSSWGAQAFLDNYGSNVGSSVSGNANSRLTLGITTDPTKSGMVVDKTVPSGWNLYYYVGDTVQDASLINAGAVLGQLADKISRTAASDKELVVGWGMPDYSAVITPTDLKDSIKTYTVPFDSMICGQIYNGTLYCNEQRIGSCSSTQVSVPLTFFANKNDVVRLEGSSYTVIRVFPLKGVK